uniref:X-linked inhibitor of apoptosis protein n=1 Tax=Eriocheir sinensis TaxID=95602 RepID=A0A2S1ZNX5_ERISI|nr:X-linked inhibitor of apoptosis protein [Eriocheir sinensis]
MDMSRRQFDGMPVKTSGREPEPRGERRFHSQIGLMLEAVRRQTFVDWPLPFVDPDSLAKAGFFYLKTKDHVQCVFCNGIVGFWDEGGEPEVEHRKHFSTCPFMTGGVTGNVPAVASPETDEGRLYQLLNQYYASKVAHTRPPLPATYQADSTRVPCDGQAAFPHLSTPMSRLRTFAEWPKDTTGVEAEMLSEAGFFYTGMSDFTQCFHCGGGLFAWRRGDNPLTDHEHFYPFCNFIRMQRKESGGAEHSSAKPGAQQRHRTLGKEEAELLLHHPMAKRVLELGLPRASVKEALKLRLETRGVLCKSVTEALELVFDYDERQRQMAAKELVRDGLQQPEPEEQETSNNATPAESAMEVETKEHFLPPTPPPEQSGQPTASEYARLQQEVQALQQQVLCEERRLTCRECGKERVAVVFQPCSHLHLCANCARPRDSCITCGSIARGTLRPIIG